MNDKTYQELLVKTASFDPATILLYKFAGANKAIKQTVRQPAIKDAVKNIVGRVLGGFDQFVQTNADKLNKSIDTIANKGKWVSDATMFPGISEAPNNKRILKELINILKNPLTLGAGAGAALTTAGAGAAGYAGYKQIQKNKANKQEAAPKAE